MVSGGTKSYIILKFSTQHNTAKQVSISYHVKAEVFPMPQNTELSKKIIFSEKIQVLHSCAQQQQTPPKKSSKHLPLYVFY